MNLVGVYDVEPADGAESVSERRISLAFLIIFASPFHSRSALGNNSVRRVSMHVSTARFFVKISR